jgi:hypothetical protein
MRLLLIQLSDIHFRASGDYAMSRSSSIVDAVKDLEPELAACIVLITGDVANTGSVEEYNAAYEFIEQVRGRLREDLPRQVPTYFVSIPGNHDCDLRNDQSARDVIRSSLANDSGPIGGAIVEVCTQSQRAFFEFRDVIADGAMEAAGDRLYYEYRFRINDEEVELRCLNTAWLSQLHEIQGTLFFPPQVISNRNESAALSLTAMHHPFPWFNNTTRRDLQSRIENVSDIVFTGHEHAHTRRLQVLSTGEVNQFIEGAALQDHEGNDASSFNALVLDTTNRRQRFIRFEWNGDLYARLSDGSWEDFQVNRLRARGEFKLRPEFEKRLDDLGINLEKKDFGQVGLTDVYVFPELREISTKRRVIADVVQGDELVDTSLNTPNLLITGVEQSGKSSFAKAMFSRFKASGLVPLLVDGTKFKAQSGERLYDALWELFLTEYRDTDLEKFRQLDRERRVVILDDLHKMRAPRGSIEAFLNGLTAFAGRVVLLSNDLAYAFGEIARIASIVEERVQFSRFAMLPFGYAKRTELTSKWFLLGNTDAMELAQRIRDADEVMDVVLGKNYVPAFPVFILAMLQGLDSDGRVDTGASTYGYFFEIIVSNSLAQGSTRVQYDILKAYLARIAYRMFSSRLTALTDGEWRAAHAEYEKWADVKLSLEQMLSDLTSRRVLVRSSDAIEFKYRFLYYYFVASYLRDHIGDLEIRDQVRGLTERLTDEESANIMLFLAHLSRDPLIIDQMLRTAREQFAGQQVATLESDVAFVSKLAALPPELDYQDGDELANRRARAESRDQFERSQEHPVAEIGDQEETDQDRASKLYLARLVTAVKTLQILGQLLKNFPGSIEGAQKERIAHECYSLGFRVLGSVLGVLEKERDELVRQVADGIRADNSGEGDETIVEKASSVVFGLALAAAYGTIKRISFSVGSPELESTYNRVAAAMPTNAVRLVNMAIRLDQFAPLPATALIRLGKEIRDFPLAFTVLRLMAVEHINLFPVGFREKQEVFSILDITYKSAVGTNPRRRLLGPAVKASE